jgi:hypothetical protein
MWGKQNINNDIDQRFIKLERHSLAKYNREKCDFEKLRVDDFFSQVYIIDKVVCKEMKIVFLDPWKSLFRLRIRLGIGEGRSGDREDSFENLRIFLRICENPFEDL